MRVVLAGTRSFGCKALDLLLDEGHDVALVVAPVDDKLANYASHRHNLPVLHEMSADVIERARADLIVCAHSHAFVGAKSRAATKLGALVGHPSLLPRHRGRDSVEWTVRMNDPIAGFTWFWADSGVDTGPVAIQDWCFVGAGETASSLWGQRLFPMGLLLLRAVLDDLERGKLVAIPQDPCYATTEPAVEPKRLYRPELPEIGSGPEGFVVVASKEDPLAHRTGLDWVSD